MTFGPIADYLPHRPPMLLLDRVEACSNERVVCRATIRPDCVLVQRGMLHGSTMIELVAQACAVHAGIMATGARRSSGLLVSCREVTLHVEYFAVGDELLVAATRQATVPPLTTFEGTVTRDGALCVSMQLSVMDDAKGVLA